MNGNLLSLALGATIIVVVVAGAIGLAAATLDVLGIGHDLDAMLGRSPPIRWEDGVR